MEKQIQKQNSDINVRKILKHEVTQFLAIAGFIFTLVKMVILPIYGIQKDIENINGNHLMHIQDSIKKIEIENKQNIEEHTAILRKLERNSTILEQLILNK